MNVDYSKQNELFDEAFKVEVEIEGGSRDDVVPSLFTYYGPDEEPNPEDTHVVEACSRNKKNIEEDVEKWGLDGQKVITWKDWFFICRERERQFVIEPGDELQVTTVYGMFPVVAKTRLEAWNQDPVALERGDGAVYASRGVINDEGDYYEIFRSV